MKKSLLWIVVLVLSISMVAAFSFAGCKKEAAPAEEAVEEEVVAEEEAAVKEKPFEGVEINLWTLENPLFTIAWKEIEPELLEKEGIILKEIRVPHAQLEQRIELLFRDQRGEVDIVTWPEDMGSRMKGENYLMPLDSFINDPDLTPPEWDFGDFIPEVLENITWEEDGGLMGIPLATNSLILFYRTDIFEEAGLTLPKTWEEYLETAKLLNNPEEGLYGNIIMAKGGENLYIGWIYMCIMASLEGDLEGSFPYDMETYEINVNTEAGKRAAEIIMEAMKYSSPDSLGYDWTLGQEAMQLGKGAMFMQWTNSKGMYQDPEKSLVVDKVMSVTIPGGSHPVRAAWVVGMLNSSQKKEAAWTVMRYIFDKEHQLKYAINTDTAWTSIRRSISSDPELLEVWPDYQIIQEQLSTAIPVPVEPGFKETHVILSRHLGKMVQGLVDIDTTLVNIEKDMRDAFINIGVLEE